MTDDEERQQLKRELLAVKLSLKRKQEFWETPRNVAILIGVTAAIAAAIGYWLGRGSAPPTLLFRPIINGNSDSMRTDQFIDAVQTAGIVVIAAMVVYVVLRLERALTTASEKLKEALTTQRALQETIERVWRRVDLLEQNPKVMLDEIRRRLDRLEAGDGH